MNKKNPKVALTNEQRETLAGTLDIFAEALRERRELRQGDFNDVIREIAHYRESPCPCGKPSVPGTSLHCGEIVRTDVFIHKLEPFTLGAIRRAVEQGLVPSGLDFTGDDSIVILRFTPPRDEA
jgi:hypothetical protein